MSRTFPAPAATPAPPPPRAPPADGYTILVVSTGFIVNPSLYAKVPYDPIKRLHADHAWWRPRRTSVSVHPSFPAKSIKELIALVKANPGKYSYAQPATGSTPHLAGELFKLRYGLDLAMVPFTSAGLAMNSTIGGHTPIAFTALPPAMTNIQAGKLRGLAVLASKRSAGAARRADHDRGRRSRPGSRHADRHRRACRHAEGARRPLAQARSSASSRCPTSRSACSNWASIRSPTRRRNSARGSRARAIKWDKVAKDAQYQDELKSVADALTGGRHDKSILVVRSFIRASSRCWRSLAGRRRRSNIPTSR